VLNDRERELLFEIERGLLVEDPEPVRSFGAVRQHRPADHRRGTDVITMVAGLMLCVLLWIGPRPLTDAEIATRGSTPRAASGAQVRSRSRYRFAQVRTR
jgi:hypothetical protein